MKKIQTTNSIISALEQCLAKVKRKTVFRFRGDANSLALAKQLLLKNPYVSFVNVVGDTICFNAWPKKGK